MDKRDFKEGKYLAQDAWITGQINSKKAKVVAYLMSRKEMRISNLTQM